MYRFFDESAATDAEWEMPEIELDTWADVELEDWQVGLDSDGGYVEDSPEVYYYD